MEQQSTPKQKGTQLMALFAVTASWSFVTMDLSVLTYAAAIILCACALHHQVRLIQAEEH